MSTELEIAREVVALLRWLFVPAQQAKELSARDHLAWRQAQSVPLRAEMRPKFLGWKEQLLPKHPIAEAVNCTLGQWTELSVFCSDGAVPLDRCLVSDFVHGSRTLPHTLPPRTNSL